MRQKIVAGNWKMNKTLSEGIALAKDLQQVLLENRPSCRVILATPYIHLASLADFLKQDLIGLAAQNVANHEEGAYTGEVSAKMIASVGCQYTLVGHSERRSYYHETSEILREKVEIALENGLTPIFCVGEQLEDREAGRQNEVISKQLQDSLDSRASSLKISSLHMNPFGQLVQGKQLLQKKLMQCISILEVRCLDVMAKL